MSLCLGVLAGPLVATSGCGTDETGEPVSPPDAAPPRIADAAPPPDAAPPFGPEVRSLRLERSIAVRAKPVADAPRLGTVARDIRVGWKGVIPGGEDCSQRWIEIEPYGWVCERYVSPSERRPYGIELPRLERGEIVPGVYGKVVTEGAVSFVRQDEEVVAHRRLAGSVMVRRYGELTAVPASMVPPAPDGGVPAQEEAAPAPGSGADPATGSAQADGGVPVADAAAGTPAPSIKPPTKPIDLWLIDKRAGEYLAAKDIRELEPSTFHGTRLGDETGLTLPMGFPLLRRRMDARVPVYSAAEGGRVVRKIPGRVPVPVLETAAGPGGAAVAYRIGEDLWVRAQDMRLAARTEPPHLTGPVERWIDIDLDQQVLVAYEGDLPVYTTLVSTGTRKTPTETGVYRIWVKFAETDMKDLAGESPYSVATVPWTQFYAKDLALHTSYWHDKLGMPRSHGCTNLAPGDARFLYFWSDPQVPPGWSMANGSVDVPGSLVRVRSKADPQPALRGYATRVYEARLARQASSSP